MNTTGNNRIQGEMIAPQSGSEKKTLPNLQIPYQGMHQALCIGMIDLGTHSESFKGEAPKDRRKIQLIFEYPMLKQLVYEDDTVPRSYLIYRDISFSMYQSELLKITSALSNGLYPEKDLEKVNLFKFLGARLYTGIKHAPKKGDPSVIYANIESYSRVGQDPAPANFISDGKLYSFYIDPDGFNFTTDNFAELPTFIRKKILDSKEAIAYKERGGQFAEQKTANSDTNYSADNTPSQSHIQPPAGYSFEDLSGGNGSYADYINGGWKDQQLIERGFLKQIPQQQQYQQPVQQQIAPPPTANNFQQQPIQQQAVQQQMFQQPVQQQMQQPQQPVNNFAGQPIQQAPQQLIPDPNVPNHYQQPNNAGMIQQPVQQQYQDPNANMQYQQPVQQQQPMQQQAVQQQPNQNIQQQPVQSQQQGINPFAGDDDDLPF